MSTLWRSKMKKITEPSIKNRCIKGDFRAEQSSLDYQIVASRKIIQEIYDLIAAIEAKYVKLWEKNEAV